MFLLRSFSGQISELRAAVKIYCEMPHVTGEFTNIIHCCNKNIQSDLLADHKAPTQLKQLY